MTLTQKIREFLISHPIDETANNKYSQVCKKFKISSKHASNIWRALQRTPVLVNDNGAFCEKESSICNDIMQITLNRVDIEVKSLDDLLAMCEVDEKVWEVVSWQCKKWDLGIKNKENAIETKALYSVSAKFKQRKIDVDLQLQKEVILKDLLSYSPVRKEVVNKYSNHAKRDKLLELSLFDVHFGKLAHKDEVGEDYDLKIAVERYKTAIQELLLGVNLQKVERILFPIGQDLINIDNLSSTTTAGTPQDCDSRFHKIIKTVKELLIDTIVNLSHIAPVDVVGTPGNHDLQTSYMVTELLDAYFHNDKNVTVYNSPAPRKYYKYGKVSIMYSHGDKEKFNELGMIFAAENPKLWGDTEYRIIHIGHRHCNKLQVMQKDEMQGFTLQILPSLSGTDAWHKGKGYQSLKQAKAFIYDKEDGQISEHTFTAKK